MTYICARKKQKHGNARMGVDRIEASVGEKPAACQPGLLTQLYIRRKGKNAMISGKKNCNKNTYLGSKEGNDQVTIAIMCHS